MLSSYVVTSLPYVHWLKLALGPKAEQIFRDPKASSKVIQLWAVYFFQFL